MGMSTETDDLNILKISRYFTTWMITRKKLCLRLIRRKHAYGNVPWPFLHYFPLNVRTHSDEIQSSIKLTQQCQCWINLLLEVSSYTGCSRWWLGGQWMVKTWSSQVQSNQATIHNTTKTVPPPGSLQQHRLQRPNITRDTEGKTLQVNRVKKLTHTYHCETSPVDYLH